MDAGFAYQGTVNVASEASYAYTAKDGSCKTSFSTAIPKGGVTGHKDVSGETDLLDAVTTVGPISVAIQADQSAFQNYHSGVMTGTCGTQLDHGVLTVGFGTDSGTKYWKVKNSWGTSWGADGYILIERGTNKCGISNQPSYPTVSGSPGPAPAPTPPAPPTTTAPPAGTHYEKPPCTQADEVALQIQGQDGVMCTPKCDASGMCPTDVPAGTKATPRCMLKDAAGDQFCALHCGLDSGCPGDAKCHYVQFPLGLCLYPADTIQGKVATMANLVSDVTV